MQTNNPARVYVDKILIIVGNRETTEFIKAVRFLLSAEICKAGAYH